MGGVWVLCLGRNFYVGLGVGFSVLGRRVRVKATH